MSAREPAQYAPGQQLPGTVYRVVRHLATGGMGSVYDVEDVTVGKRYVLKTLHPQLVSRHDLAKRMEAEARALAKLQHPNIVDVVTAGMTTDDQRMPFYVMERLNGQNLRVVIEKKGSLELTHCYRIAIDVLDALEHAHENSVIHRDVKPENIFLHRNPNGTTITKLLDFGIMRLLDRKASHTQGKFIGTLRYASPEQIFGGELGPPTDIYSLGIVLYEMVAGRGPFDEIGDAYAIGAAHAQRPPPALSTFMSSVPPELERIVMSALAKSPADRPRDCFSFASELRRLLKYEESAPRSMTAVNVLTSAPNTRAVDGLPHAGTEASPAPTGGAANADGPPTAVGMPPPSMMASPTGAVTRGEDIGVAATVPSEPGAEPIRDVGPIAEPARAAPRVGSVPGAKPAVDRSAETRAASGVSGVTQRLAPNDTSIDAGYAAPLPEEAVREALAQHQPLEVPPTSGGPVHDARNHELVFPKQRDIITATGPLSAEASTRPPERSMVIPLLVAALVGATLVSVAILAVTKPWQKSSSLTTTSPPAVAVPDSPPASPSPSVAPPSSVSPSPSSSLSASRPLPPRKPDPSARAAPTAPAVPPTPPKRPPSAKAPRPEDVPFE